MIVIFLMYRMMACEVGAGSYAVFLR
ncbi:hypothetical protein PM8797T_26880 [Gimesia maris DSM 8797]|nr:hypothetical protein PM8797T_26880 [Gimesia maris DSM 8797]